MKRSFKKTVLLILPIALGVFLVWWMYHSLSDKDLEKVKNAFIHANYYWVALSLFFGLLSHLSRAYRWRFLLTPLGYSPRFSNSVFSIFTAYLVNLVFPRAGEVVRATTIANYEGIPFEKTFGTIVAERVIDVVMLLLIIATAFFFQFELLSKMMTSKIPNNPTVLVVVTVIAVLVFALLFYLIRKSNQPIFTRIRHFIMGLLAGMISIFKMKNRGAFIFHTLFIWGMYLLMFYVASLAIPETANLSLGAIITGFVVGSLSMAATNGGLGSYPYGIQKVLMLYGIAGNPALAFGLLMWSSQTLMVVIFGGFSFFALSLLNEKAS